MSKWAAALVVLGWTHWFAFMYGGDTQLEHALSAYTNEREAWIRADYYADLLAGRLGSAISDVDVRLCLLEER